MKTSIEQGSVSVVSLTLPEVIAIERLSDALYSIYLGQARENTIASICRDASAFLSKLAPSEADIEKASTELVGDIDPEDEADMRVDIPKPTDKAFQAMGKLDKESIDAALGRLSRAVAKSEAKATDTTAPEDTVPNNGHPKVTVYKKVRVMVAGGAINVGLPVEMYSTGEVPNGATLMAYKEFKKADLSTQYELKDPNSQTLVMLGFIDKDTATSAWVRGIDDRMFYNAKYPDVWLIESVDGMNIYLVNGIILKVPAHITPSDNMWYELIEWLNGRTDTVKNAILNKKVNVDVRLVSVGDDLSDKKVYKFNGSLKTSPNLDK